MLFPENSSSLERIVELLLEEPTPVEMLRERLIGVGHPASLSGVYKHLSLLKASNIVIKRAGAYEVSNEWRDSVVRTLSRTGVRGLREGERVVHTLASIADTDRLWKQYVFDIVGPHMIKTFHFYDPHQFWLHDPERSESEHAFIQFAKRRKIAVFHTIGYRTPEDRAFGKMAAGDGYQVHYEHLDQFSDCSHVSVIGDIIIDTRVNRRLTNQIHTIYKALVGADLKAAIAELLTHPQRCSFTIERSKDKAARLARRMSRNFVHRRVS